MIDPATILRQVEDDAGRRVAFGELQADWLLEHGHITGEPPLFKSCRLTALELHDLVNAQPELRECDFCGLVPAEWLVPVRSFMLRRGPTPGPFLRSVVACDVCVGYVRRRDRDGLIEYGIASRVEIARARGGELQQIVESHSWKVIKAHLTPIVGEFVRNALANVSGDPVRDGEEKAA